MNRIAVIIVAGGSGSRMGAEVPKQFLVLDGLPILMHTIRRFAETLADAGRSSYCPQRISAIGGTFAANTLLRRRMKSARAERPFRVGAPRIGSCGDAGLVAVHDGVRPLVGREVILRAVRDAQAYGAVIPVVAPVDSLRRIADGGSNIVDRSAFRHRPDSAGFPHGNSPESLSTAFSGLFYRRCERGRGGRRTDISLRRFLYEYQNYYAGRYRDGRGVAESPVVPPRQSVPPVPVPWSF